MSDEEGSGEHKPPLGLFRKSDRPPPPEGDAASDEAARNEAARKRFKSTLLGVPAVTGAAAGDAKQSTLAGHPAVPPAPPPAAGPSGRPSVPNKPPKTLVGHPAVPPPQPGKPVVAPPKWRGAKAYLDGDVPELRQSGTPPPPPAASALQPPPAPAGEDALRDSVERFLQAEDEREGRSSVEAAPVAIVTSSAEPQGDERGSVEELDLDILDDAEEVEPSAAERAPATPATSAPPPTPPRRRPPPAPRQRPVASTRPAEDSALSARLQASPLEPIAALDDDGRRAPKLGAALIGLVLLVGVGGWLVTMGGYQRRDLVNTPAEATKPAEAAPAAAPEAEATKPEAEPAAGPEAAPEAEPEAEAAALPPEAEHSSDDTAPPPAPRTKKTAPNPRKATPRPQPRPASRPPEPEPAPVITVKPSRPEPEPPPADLPETPGREAVQAALQKVRPRIVECAPGQHGVAEAEITVAGSGEVIHAVIGGYYAAKPEGSCMARALRGARFPRFARPRFTVVYPFRF